MLWRMEVLWHAVRYGTSPYWHHEYSGNRLLAVATALLVCVCPSRSYHQ